ncbi:hypothetical protein GCM10010924_12160 [Rhizobium wenxiniae]|uniref:Putative DNA primase/helicase n=1 Tax=Rhizobium wenxiniae TaxID=1737357 RepID=A0A7X0CYA3_9HYPH|nr:DNA primase family protein [Rhizobium wenxiniae]MBB6161064.1 putative DNA primase/helicase [Rhizobium wenxiniae]GGF86071.1 hypothetical protein GCM10010924_12160 [Rhizobium wenxiniae]
MTEIYTGPITYPLFCDGEALPNDWTVASARAIGWTDTEIAEGAIEFERLYDRRLPLGNEPPGQLEFLAPAGENEVANPAPVIELPSRIDLSSPSEPDPENDLSAPENPDNWLCFSAIYNEGGRPILYTASPDLSAGAMISDEFMSAGGMMLRYYRGDFWRWNGAAYHAVKEDDMKAVIRTYLRKAVTIVVENKEKAEVPFNPTINKVNEVLASLKALCKVSDDVDMPAWLNEKTNLPKANELLPVSNGLLRLLTGELFNATPSFFNAAASSVEYSAAAGEPVEWLKFLASIWGDDQQSIETLQEYLGYLVSGSTALQKGLMIIGPKRSGKGTIQQVIEWLVGKVAIANPTLSGLTDDFGLSPLIGRTVAIITDARLSGRADLSSIAERILAITGEDSMTINRKGKDYWTGRLQVRFVIMSNEIPRLTDASGALVSRMIMLNMTKSFYGREDLTLKGRLAFELPGILNWAIAGYKRLIARGFFVTPKSAQDSINEMTEMSSPIKAFSTECLRASGPARRELRSEVFNMWKEWCLENGEFAGSAAAFTTKLRSVFPNLGSVQLTGGKRCYVGVEVIRDPAF